MSHFFQMSDLFVELKVCEWQLYSFSDFLLLNVHTTNVSIHHIWLLVWMEEHREKQKLYQQGYLSTVNSVQYL